MKVNSKVGVIWAVAVFVVIGLVLVLVASLNGGDDNDQEKQPRVHRRVRAGHRHGIRVTHPSVRLADSGSTSCRTELERCDDR